MKNWIQCLRIVLVLFTTAGLQIPSVHAQGSLTPPGAPAPMMKSLSQIEPRAPISSLPFNITNAGSYYLTTNLTGVSGQEGVSVSCGNVTVDLNGFALLGVSGSLSGIYFAGSGTYTNVTVRNGTISDWGGSGVDAYSVGYPRNLVFENLTLSANGGDGIQTEASSIVRDCLVMNNNSDGIYSAGGEINRCLARANGNNGIEADNCAVCDCEARNNLDYGLLLNQSSATDSESLSNGFDGIYIIQSSRVTGCQSQGNGNNGITALSTGSPDEVLDCRVCGNFATGISLSESGVVSGNYVANNEFGIVMNASGSEITGNNCYSNTYTAIFLTGTGNRIDNNNLVVPGGSIGIFFNGSSSTNNLVIRNSVTGNSFGNYSLSAGNDVGPIGNASTNTSPWANFSH
jgi:hypothetical protein